MLAVAVIVSNQDRNLGALAGYNEAGGAQQIGYRVHNRLEARGVRNIYVVPPLESGDLGNVKLAATLRQTAATLSALQAQGLRACAVHIHTNAGGTPEQGTSHTGYCHTRRVPEGAKLGAAVCTRLPDVLTLPIVAYDYTGLGYLFETLFGDIPSTIIEVTRHDRRADLDVLYARVDAVADAIVDGVLAWAGETATQADPRDAEIARLRALLARLGAEAITGSEAGA